MKQITQDFIKRLGAALPLEKAENPFIVALIGMPGSGRTTVAKMLVKKLTGAVLVSSNSARYLLREEGMSWDENVRQVIKGVAKDLLERRYAVIFDGNAADEADRKSIEELAATNGAKVFYIRINIDTGTAKQREKVKYDDPDWVSSFEEFRVNTTEAMLKNIDDRSEVHRKLNSADIPGPVGEIDNNAGLEELEKQIDKIADKIKEG